MYSNYSIIYILQFQFHEKEFQLRTRDTHLAQCSSLQGPLHQHIATTYGLNRDSLLDSLHFFHTAEALILDIMHDILEGVLPLAIKYLLKHMVDLKLVTVSEINSRIDKFDFGVIESGNKPRGTITSAQLNGDHIKQSGESQQHKQCMRTICKLMDAPLSDLNPDTLDLTHHDPPPTVLVPKHGTIIHAAACHH